MGLAFVFNRCVEMTVTLLYDGTCLRLAFSDCIAHYHTCSSLKPYTSIASQFLLTYSLSIARLGPPSSHQGIYRGCGVM